MAEREEVARQGYSVLAERSTNRTWANFFAKPPTRQTIGPLFYGLLTAEEIRYNGRLPDQPTDRYLKNVIAAQNLRTQIGRDAAEQIFRDKANNLKAETAPYEEALRDIYDMQRQGVTIPDLESLKEAESFIAQAKEKIKLCQQAIEVIP